MSVCFCYVCHLPSHQKKEAAFSRLHKEGAEGLLRRPPPFVDSFTVAGEVANIIITHRRTSKYAMNLYFYAYIFHIPLKPLSS